MSEFYLKRCDDSGDYLAAYDVVRVADNVVVGELVKERLSVSVAHRTHNYSWEFYPGDDYYTQYAPRHFDGFRHAKGAIEQGAIKRMKL